MCIYIYTLLLGLGAAAGPIQPIAAELAVEVSLSIDIDIDRYR